MSTVTCLCSYCKPPSVSALLTNASLWFAASLASPDKTRRTALPPSSNTALLGPSLLDSNSHDCFQSRGLPDVAEVRGNTESPQLLSGRPMSFDMAHYRQVLLFLFFHILPYNEDKQEVRVFQMVYANKSDIPPQLWKCYTCIVVVMLRPPKNIWTLAQRLFSHYRWIPSWPVWWARAVWTTSPASMTSHRSSLSQNRPSHLLQRTDAGGRARHCSHWTEECRKCNRLAGSTTAFGL